MNKELDCLKVFDIKTAMLDLHSVICGKLPIDECTLESQLVEQEFTGPDGMVFALSAKVNNGMVGDIKITILTPSKLTFNNESRQVVSQNAELKENCVNITGMYADNKGNLRPYQILESDPLVIELYTYYIEDSRPSDYGVFVEEALKKKPSHKANLGAMLDLINSSQHL